MFGFFLKHLQEYSALCFGPVSIHTSFSSFIRRIDAHEYLLNGSHDRQVRDTERADRDLVTHTQAAEQQLYPLYF